MQTKSVVNIFDDSIVRCITHKQSIVIKVHINDVLKTL